MAIMRILFSTFAGITPRVSAEKLPEVIAQIAQNVDLHRGNIAPFRQNGIAIALPSSQPIIQTAYLWRVNDAEYWFRFQHEVEVARSPIADDENKRVYWTGDLRYADEAGLAYPQMSYTPIAYTGGTDFPQNSYRLGIPAPTLPVGVSLTGSTTKPELSDFRFYVRTYVSEVGEEGPPSPVSMSVLVGPGQSVLVSGLGLNSGDGTARNITKQRIYRTNTGNASAAFQFVAELAIAAADFTDSLDGDDLIEILPSTDWLPPPVGLRGLRLMANGVMVGFVGNEVCFSEPYLPHAWPPRYRLTVDYPVVAIGSYDTTIVVATQGRPFLITGSHPSSMSQRELDLIEPCISMRSMASMGHGCVYASRNGLVYVGGGTAELVTQRVVTREEWAAFQPYTIRASEYRQMYVAFYGTSSGNGGGFLMSPLSPEGGMITLNQKVRALHRDPLNENLHLLDWSKNVSQFEGGAGKMTATWRSKITELERPAQFTVLRAETSFPESTVINVYADGALIASPTITNNKPVRLPAVGRKRTWEIEVVTTGEIHSVSLAETVAEV